ncbi:DUF3047 domain-containing protein [sulfur-oxidizing endosymbiont of Gigantopelta aegis]|uniref:DUF3047 domain-containing protein n=1 Tax=sulfur-oxidizing endosymbiont of Gigantopelta aegis TaxID=2794934 RepID=UPI002483E5AA|nr:DUF3047 domain-containing protein [sulfur-oxidizing endosymbiont of Gigantopelta aegis]
MSLFIFFILLYSSSTFAQTNNNVINANEAVNKSQKVIIGEFSQQSLTGWEEKEFAGKTRYKLIKIAGQYVLSARSQQAASGLFKTIHIDLNKTPYLNWSWSIQSSLNNINEQSKSGDDYAARIYIVKKHFFSGKRKP